ncbi:DNA polymerase zeta catalytic subunit isoform X2 [Coccinella septempunctata]|nr:DNA polymerase zeta catalytic subunit isoform X2 [Coccinella septempunctata]
MLIKRVNNLLFNESVLGKIYQPHETHLNFTLQFMIDYNLHGMSNIVLSQVKFRHTDGVRENEEFVEENLSKVSSCELECDTMGEYILNRKEVESGNLAANPGIAALWEDERQRRRNKNEDSQLPHYLSLSNTNVDPTESHELFKRALQERLAILSQDPDKNDFNLSIYPAECPNDKPLLNCSNVDFHSPLNTQSDVSFDAELDQTISNDTLNITVDQDVQNLLDVLKDLEKNVVVEEDSILSQVSKNENEDVDEDHDMTITIGSSEDLLNESIKLSQIHHDDETVQEKEISEESEQSTREFPTIPQLDGNCSDGETQISVDPISHVRESNDLVFKLELGKITSLNEKMILHMENNNNSLPYSPNSIENMRDSDKTVQSIQMDKSIVFEVKISSQKKYTNRALEYLPQGCQSKHKYPHIENSLNKKLFSSKIVEAKKSNNQIIQGIIDKEHDYFAYPSVGERVARKNAVKRHKEMLRQQLKNPCELVVISENLHLPQIARRKRDMPSLNSTGGNESSSSSSAITRWKSIKKSVNADKTKIDKVKKTIQRQRFSDRKEELHKNHNKRKLLVQKFCRDYAKCWEDLNKGAKPIFKIIPGYRPYTFKPMEIKKLVRIETLTRSTSRIQVSRTVISKELIPSDVHMREENNNGCDVNQNELASTNSMSLEQNSKNSEIKKKINTRTKATKKIPTKRNAEKQVQTADSRKEEVLDVSTNFNDPPPEKPTVKKSIEDIFRAQKQNEALFFHSVHSVMDRFTISENKLLESSTVDARCNLKSIQFLDGAFDDSDEEERDKPRSSRSSKKTRSTYSSLPIFTSASGRSTSNTGHTDSKKKNKAELRKDPEITENMKKIKRRINFDSSSPTETEAEDAQNTEKEQSQNDDTKKTEAKTETDEPCTESVEGRQAEQVNEDDPSLEQPIEEQAAAILDEGPNEEPPLRLSASELYDLARNYFPQPGCSTFADPVVDVQPDLGNIEDPYAYQDDDLDDDMWLSTPEYDNPDEISPLDPTPADTEAKERETPKVTNGLVYYKPLYKPPNRLEVILSLRDYGIPSMRHLEPFYSNVEDASGSMEVGLNVLKVKTLTTRDVPEFESSFQGLDHYRRKYYPLDLRLGKREHQRIFYCPEGDCTIRPLFKPPTRREVEEWLEKNSVPTEPVEESKTRKSKIYFASSQDGDCSDDDLSMDLTLTLTPTTPQTDTVKTPESNIDNMALLKEISLGEDEVTENRESLATSDVTLTPKSSRSRESRGSSPVLAKSRRKRRLGKSTTLRKSALLSQSSEHSGVISGASPNNTYGFQCSVQNYQNARASVKYEYLTILSMELHVNTREDLKPNPQYDPIQAIFYCISNDVEENTVKPRKCEGLFAVNPRTDDEKSKRILDGTGISYDVEYVEDELKLFEEFTKFVIRWDPDILLGYEIQMLSWGYLIERCFHLGINIIPEISRVKDKHLKFNEKETGDLKVTGRVVLDLWRLLRHEIALQSYTIQSTVYEILQRRIPKYSFKDLTTWWSHRSSLFRHRTVDYYMTCVSCQLKILEQLDFVGRTSELARLFGIQFYEVLSRGSQFRVESMMLRLAKPLNYVAVSPSVQQRANMKAPEHIALVLEPESKLYTDPVIVLDFQSLYPSIIIAYNYCFSTCAGRVESLGKNTQFEFGASNLRVSKERIQHLLKRDLLNFSPCGVAFVKKNVRDGIMPRMLREILDTRLMVKKSMKENKGDSVLQKVLHNRQLGLKLIANVTYGYTAANFSGRMPSVELGDSIVSKARETLQRTIALVDRNKEWGVKVVYGDTDSLFVLCPGKSRPEAFAIGEKIVEAVGNENPDPVKLKLEKVYQPCILQTKKRYVGYMYESPEQKVPTYDAKGIETVRRDGCPAVSKMLEKSLRILFETRDVSKVKEYCLKQFHKIVSGRTSIKDFTFAKEFRGLTGYRPGACVPSLELAKKWVAVDKRAEPRRGERVPYVIINGPPGLPLIRMVRSPHELLKDPSLRPNALYYITRVIIPPLNRCFNLIGADLHHWFLQMPRKHLKNLPTSTSPAKKSTISQYFISTLCAICGVQTQSGLCDDCCKKPQETVTILNERARQWEASYYNCKLICSSCTQILEDTKCISLDCPVLYRLNQTGRDVQQADHIRHLLSQYFDIL